MDVEKVLDKLRSEGFSAKYFLSGGEAADYLCNAIKDKSVGMGGSVTVQELDLFDRLTAAGNQVYWHWRQPVETARQQAMLADIYICSANAVAETGEIISIDGDGNRVASSIYGHEKVYIIIGTNKIAPDCEQAMWRARNIAAPLNARRLKRKTPCALGTEIKCYDCKSPERICRSINILTRKTVGNQAMEVIIINGKFGY